MFCHLITACNGRSLLAPVLEIQPPLDPKPFESAMANLDSYDGIIITSSNGARALLAMISASGIANMAVPAIFAVGKKTATIIQKAGYAVTIPDQAAGGEDLAEAIKGWHVSGGRFLFPQAEKGREEVVTILTGVGYRVDRVVAYRASPVDILPRLVMQALADGQVDAIPFFSANTARAFLQALPPEGKKWLKKPLLIAISPVTKKSLEQTPITIDLVAEQSTGEGVLTKLSNYWQEVESK
jgi:uroporphyrinogen-III synthase